MARAKRKAETRHDRELAFVLKCARHLCRYIRDMQDRGIDLSDTTWEAWAVSRYLIREHSRRTRKGK